MYCVDSAGLLVAAGELVYNDAPWLTGSHTATRLVHPKLSHEVAEQVRIPTNSFMKAIGRATKGVVSPAMKSSCSLRALSPCASSPADDINASSPADV